MDDYFDVISQLKCSKRGGCKVPHKAIYLLAILDMIDFEWITDRKFHVSHELVNTFEWNWKRYVGHTPFFTCNIWNPIYHMEQDVVRYKVRPEYEKVKPACVERCQQVFEYLEIPSDLWTLLQDENYRKDIRLLLIDKYLIKKRTKKTISSSSVCTFDCKYIVPHGCIGLGVKTFSPLL